MANTAFMFVRRCRVFTEHTRVRERLALPQHPAGPPYVACAPAPPDPTALARVGSAEAGTRSSRESHVFRRSPTHVRSRRRRQGARRHRSTRAAHRRRHSSWSSGSSVKISRRRADISADGHDVIRAVARARRVPFRAVERPSRWRGLPLVAQGTMNGMRASSCPTKVVGVQASRRGRSFATWRETLRKKHEAGWTWPASCSRGQRYTGGPGHARETAGARLRAIADMLAGPTGQVERVAAALDEKLAAETAALDERPHAVGAGPARARVERLARATAVVHMFPRSYTPDASRGATSPKRPLGSLPSPPWLRRAVLPPIHPIGRTKRKDAKTRSLPRPPTQAAPGQSVDPRADTPRSSRGSGRSTTSRHSNGPPPAKDWRSRSTWRTSARPTIRG